MLEQYLIIPALLGLAFLGAGFLRALEYLRYYAAHRSWPKTVAEETYLAKASALEREKEAAISGLTQRNLLLTNENEALRERVNQLEEEVKDMTIKLISRITTK